MDRYKFPTVDPDWCDQRDLHPALGAAIHAISSRAREPHKIWVAPTPEEVEYIKDAVKEFVRRGLVEAAPGDKYVWGTDVLVLGGKKATIVCNK